MPKAPKKPATQIGLLEILGVKKQLLLKVKLLFFFILKSSSLEPFFGSLSFSTISIIKLA